MLRDSILYEELRAELTAEAMNVSTTEATRRLLHRQLEARLGATAPLLARLAGATIEQLDEVALQVASRIDDETLRAELERILCQPVNTTFQEFKALARERYLHELASEDPAARTADVERLLTELRRHFARFESDVRGRLAVMVRQDREWVSQVFTEERGFGARIGA
jgi:hypothetical protein